MAAWDDCLKFRPVRQKEADKVREALFDDPFVSNEEYGRLVEEAADADERRSLDAERGEDW